MKINPHELVAVVKVAAEIDKQIEKARIQIRAERPNKIAHRERTDMPAPQTEPNSLPDLFVDWVEWRCLYGETVESFYKTPGSVSDRVMLQIALRRLGFVGVALDAEIEFIVANRGK